MLKKISGRYDVKNDISVSLIGRFPEVITVKQKEEDLEEVWKSLNTPLKEAVDALVSMREREGSKLYKDINIKCDEIKKWLIE
ncbi:hypothetical protein CFSAN001628_012263 [Clostridium botulinum CFSAN001628]|nr:hypothetical protein CFSAN001628_012263 [Clostridium botulinum CFSAN001628]